MGSGKTWLRSRPTGFRSNLIEGETICSCKTKEREKLGWPCVIDLSRRWRLDEFERFIERLELRDSSRERERAEDLRLCVKWKSSLRYFFYYWPLHEDGCIFKIATGLLNSSRIQVKTTKSCSHFSWIEYQLYSNSIWMQKVKTATKQKKFSLGPPFFVFKHRKLCLNTETKHAHRIGCSCALIICCPSIIFMA